MIELPVDGPYDLALTLRAHRFGKSDPTMRVEDDRAVKATRVAEGPVCIEVHHDRSRGVLSVRTEGASVPLEALGAWLGLSDTGASYVPDHPGVAALARSRAGLRMVRALDAFDAHVVAILQQRVRYVDAIASYRRIQQRSGSPAPHGLRTPLDAREWMRLPSFEARAAGVDAHRFEALQHAARAAHRTRRARDAAELRALFANVRGTGPWTTEMVAGFAFADADAVPLGDVGLPHQVAAFFADDRPPSDARMLALLEPFRPQRFRVIRWILAGAPARE